MRRDHRIPVAFIPIYDSEKSKGQTQGYVCESARAMRLYQYNTTIAGGIYWDSGGTRLRTYCSRHQVISLPGQLLDTNDVSAELACKGSCVCHQCYAKRNDFLSDVDVELKPVKKRRREIEKAVPGVDIPENFQNGSDELVVGKDYSFILIIKSLLQQKKSDAAAVCWLKSLERSIFSQYFYPEMGQN